MDLPCSNAAPPNLSIYTRIDGRCQTSKGDKQTHAVLDLCHSLRLHGVLLPSGKCQVHDLKHPLMMTIRPAATFVCYRDLQSYILALEFRSSVSVRSFTPNPKALSALPSMPKFDFKAVTSSWKLFTPEEKRNIAIYIFGIMLYKFGLEAFNGSVVALATNRYDYDSWLHDTDSRTFERVGLLTGLNQAFQVSFLSSYLLLHSKEASVLTKIAVCRVHHCCATDQEVPYQACAIRRYLPVCHHGFAATDHRRRYWRSLQAC